MLNNTVRTNDLDLEDEDVRDDLEPATSHDVVEGGALGVVGGAVVGGLAGGPLGAVVGAIAGGIASAAGVAAVDRHDHDYARTVANDDALNEDYIATDAGLAGGVGDPLYPSGIVAPIPPVYAAAPVVFGAYDTYSGDYRSHFQMLYGRGDYDYTEYEPAYRYGYDLASDPRYRDSNWNAVQGSARSDWELRHAGTWDRFKDHVRYAWDRVRGQSTDDIRASDYDRLNTQPTDADLRAGGYEDRPSTFG